MKPIKKELYQFIQNNFVNPQDYDLDLKIINEQIQYKKAYKVYKFIVDIFIFINNAISIICGYSMIVVFYIIILEDGKIKLFNYEFNKFYFIFLYILLVSILLSLIEQVSKKDIQGHVKKFILSIFSFFSPLKYKQKELFNKYVNKLKLKVSNKIENQNNLINELRWLYDKSISYMREIQMSIKNFENEFNNIKEINTAFQLGLSDADKSTFDSKNKNSDWWKMEEKIQQTKSRLEDEIIKREKDEIIKKEKEIEDERIKNEKRLIALAEYEKKQEEQNKINEENRLQRMKEYEEKRKEREIILRIEQENRKQQIEEERFQKFLKKQSEKTKNVLKPKSKINKPGIKVNKVITPDKLKQILERKSEIGSLGEQIIFEELKSRLIGTIYHTLIDEFKHVSIEDGDGLGDGLGYDILAYNESAEKIYVEVKTTTAKYPVASFSRNEISFANQFDENYVLFLVHNLNTDDNSFEYIEINEFSNVKEQLNFQPISYKLKIKDNLSNQNNQLNL